MKMLKKSQKWWYMLLVASSLTIKVGVSTVASHCISSLLSTKCRNSGPHDCRGKEAVAWSRREVSRSQPETTIWPGRKISVEYLRFSFLTLISNPLKSIMMLDALHDCRCGAQMIEDFELSSFRDLVHKEELPALRFSR